MKIITTIIKTIKAMFNGEQDIEEMLAENFAQCEII